MTLKVKYMSGAGNLFTVINAVNTGLENYDFTEFAPILCGIKGNTKLTEGLIVAKSPIDGYDFVIEFYNPDGSKGMMCGNGGRCAVHFAQEMNITDKDSVDFYMAGSEYHAETIGNEILLELPPPISFEERKVITLENKEIQGSFVDVGSDHFVINISEFNIEKVSDIDIIDSVRPIRYHKAFQPNGTNVNIYQIDNKDQITLRTYERGVEAETGACGTGSISTALTTYLRNEITLPVTIIPPSGIPLTVNIIGDIPNNIIKFQLQGHAEIIGEASFELDL